MLGQLPEIEVQAGPCSDCGSIVSHRKVCQDSMTHSIVELCEACWHAQRQRQAFGGGCCG